MLVSNILIQVKQCLGITDNTQDTTLICSILSSLWAMETVMWCNPCKVDDLWNDMIHTQYIRWCLLNWECVTLYLCVPNITEVISIWDKILTSSDYDIDGSCIYLKWCRSMCGCGMIKIQYKWWRELLPNDRLWYFVNQAQSSLCGTQTIKKITLWDKTVEYCCDVDSQKTSSMLESLYTKYQAYHSINYCSC